MDLDPELYTQEFKSTFNIPQHSERISDTSVVPLLNLLIDELNSIVASAPVFQQENSKGALARTHLLSAFSSLTYLRNTIETYDAPDQKV